MAKEIEIKCQGKTGHFPVGITVKEALLALLRRLNTFTLKLR